MEAVFHQRHFVMFYMYPSQVSDSSQGTGVKASNCTVAMNTVGLPVSEDTQTLLRRDVVTGGKALGLCLESYHPPRDIRLHSCKGI